MSRARLKRPSRRLHRSARIETQAVVDETIALFQWLTWVAEELHGDTGPNAPRRWVLRRLQRHGPQTVPALARAKALRRQSVQPVVDALVADGFVELVDNPAHVRSKRATLTARGAALVARMDRVDAKVLRAVSGDISRSALVTTAATLRALRGGFEVESRWRSVASHLDSEDRHAAT
jgi:DNA-binding MarR family transcriptional regulator